MIFITLYNQTLHTPFMFFIFRSSNQNVVANQISFPQMNMTVVFCVKDSCRDRVRFGFLQTSLRNFMPLKWSLILQTKALSA